MMGDAWFKCMKCGKVFLNRNKCPKCGSKEIELLDWIMGQVIKMEDKIRGKIKALEFRRKYAQDRIEKENWKGEWLIEKYMKVIHDANSKIEVLKEIVG